ncbi:MAG: penicillin acylase family protein [Terriglobia bacterium]
MRKLFLIALFCVLSLAGGLWIRRSLFLQALSPAQLKAEAETSVSVTHGTLNIPGLEKPVMVLRDRWGVPHIYAQNEHDLFFAQGFVTAQDRLFQMELWKRVGEGRLAEVFGPAYLQRDINARLLAYRGSMAAEYASYAPDAKQIIDAFTEGINAYIARCTAPGGPGLPLAFRLAGFAPEPWKPEDVLTRMAGFPMTNNSLAELLHAELVNLVGARKAASVFGFDPPTTLNPAPGVNFSGLSPQLLENLQGSDSAMPFPPDLAKPLSLLEEPGSGKWASNNWVVSGKLTATGKPILCNDPHRTVDKIPSLRYVIHLVAPGWDVIGATEPGSPGIEDGHNQHIAWGWTIFGMDQQDLYLETLDPNDPLRYKTENGWARMEVEKTTFHVRGRPDVVVDLKFTRHGPVLWEDVATHRALALRWVGAEPGTAGYLACLTLDRVQNWTQFEDFVHRWKLPTHNIVYADIDGNIGEHSVGMEPIRKNWNGLLPVPGDGGYEWAGWVPMSQLPHQFNPVRGFVVTANQRMIPENYPYKVGFSWVPPYRANRIKEVLSQYATSGHKITKEDMELLQGDISPLPARYLTKLLASVAGDSQDPNVRLLLGWNGAVERDSAAAALYEVWLTEIEQAVTHRLLPEKAWSVMAGRVPLPVILDHLEHPDAQTFGPAPEAARNQLLLDALHKAVDRMDTLEGPNQAEWAWGRIHTVMFHHPLELLPGARDLFDRGPLPRPGDSYTVNAAYYRGNNFQQVSGPSYREIIDLSDWDNSVTVNVPGESGQPGSLHYSDLTGLWDHVRYFPMIFSRAAVEKETENRLILDPASKP